MEIVFVFNSKNKSIQNTVMIIENELKQKIKNIKIEKKEKISRVSEKTMYVVVVQCLQEMLEYENCLKFKQNTIVITADITYEAITCISNKTKNICYLGTDPYLLAKRIYEISKTKDY